MLIDRCGRYMLLSTLAFALMSGFVKFCYQHHIPLLQIIAVRAFISAILCFISIRRQNIAWFGVKKGLLFCRGFVGTIALICVYSAIVHLSLAEATLIQYLYPLFTALISWVLLKERIIPSTFVCIALSLLGLIVMLVPDLGTQQMKTNGLAVALGLLGALGSAIAYLLVRKLNQTEKPAVIVLYFPLIAFPTALVLLQDNWVLPSLTVVGALIGVGLTTQIGQIALTRALQTETASNATTFAYLQVVFATFIGWFWFDEMLSQWTLFGGGLILFGVGFHAVNKNKMMRHMRTTCVKSK